MSDFLEVLYFLITYKSHNINFIQTEIRDNSYLRRKIYG